MEHNKPNTLKNIEPPMPPGLYLQDCMDAMKLFPDGFFDLAIVDPPYGDGTGETKQLTGTPPTTL